ncbi:MAG: addiction module protein [Planctomycetes bacterium]|nr:addiction module protein [Planctomycetota bacterium]
MSQSSSNFSFDHLSVAERLVLVQQIWDSIASGREASELTDAQAAELDRREAEHEQNPGDLVSWEEIKAAIQEEQ